MGEVVDPLVDLFRELGEQPPALGCGQPAPFARKRLACRLDGRIDVGGGPTRDFADLNPTRGVLDRQALARLRLDPAPADEAFVGIEPGRLRDRWNSFEHYV